jgi:hypothetical protein
MRWLSTLPEGWNRDAGVRETYRTWLRLGGDRPLVWLRGSELEPWMDPALALFARKIGVDDPEEGLECAGRIADEELRWGTLGQIAREWLVTDEPAARAWIERSELPEPYRSKTLAIPPAIRRQVTEREAARAAEEAED